MGETPREPEIGQWFRHSGSGKDSTPAPSLLFRFEGKKSDGAYVFSKFDSDDPCKPGELLGTIEIYNPAVLTPVDDE